MSAPDQLADWYRHDVMVERFTGTGAYGDIYSAAVDLLAMVDDTRRMVRGPDGSEVVSSTTVYLRIPTTAILPRSRVTLPAAFGARRSIVLAVSVHDGGGMPTPDHLELALQ